jgi:hypothetical protein
LHWQRNSNPIAPNLPLSKTVRAGIASEHLKILVQLDQSR